MTKSLMPLGANPDAWNYDRAVDIGDDAIADYYETRLHMAPATGSVALLGVEENIPQPRVEEDDVFYHRGDTTGTIG